MSRKSAKAFHGHHTSSNRRNVIRNQGWPGKGRYWRNTLKQRRRQEKRTRSKKIKFIVEFVLGIGIMVGIILALYIFSK